MTRAEKLSMYFRSVHLSSVVVATILSGALLALNFHQRQSLSWIGSAGLSITLSRAQGWPFDHRTVRYTWVERNTKETRARLEESPAPQPDCNREDTLRVGGLVSNAIVALGILWCCIWILEFTNSRGRVSMPG